MTNTAIILAGGFGTRLRARVSNLPKPMAPVGGRPFLAYLLDRLIQQGFSQVILSVGYLGDSIERHFGNRYGDLELSYSRESEPLGTGGAIRQALSYCRNASALVLNGDTYLELDYRRFVQFHSDRKSALSLVLRHVDDAGRYGAVLLDGDRVTNFCEKGVDTSGFVNAGTYLLRADTFAGYELPTRFSFEVDFLTPLCASISPFGFRTDAYMIDIGIPEDFDRAQIELPRRLSA